MSTDTITLGAKILVIDASPDSLNFLTKTFRDYGYRVRPVSDGQLALSTAQEESPDLILLDIKIPGMSGYVICEKLKANDHTRDIPVIFISAMHDILDKVRAFFVGGVDYITKPFQAEEVLARVETHLMLRRLQRNLQQKNFLLQREIMEHKQTEASLKASEERYRRLVELSPEPIMVCQADKFVYANAAAAKIFAAADAEDFIGKPIMSFVHPDYYHLVRKHLQRISGSGEATALMEEKFVRLDGRAIDVEITGAPITYQGEHAIQIVMRDITARKRMEDLLRKLQKAVETTDVGVAITDTEGRIVYINPAEATMHSYAVDELIGQRSDIFATPQRRANTTKEKPDFKKFLNWRRERLSVRKDGSAFPVKLTSNLIHDDKGEVVGIVTICEDITERKQVENALTKSESRYRSLFEHTTIGIFQATLDGKFITANPAMARILGYSSAQQLIQEVSDIAEQLYVDPQHWLEIADLARSSREPMSVETRCHSKDGREIIVTLNVWVIEAECDNICHIEGFIEDITERKKVEETLKKSIMQIERAKREWESTADSLSAVMCLLDEQGGIIRANRTIEHWNLGQVMAVKGRHIHALFHPACSDPKCYLKRLFTQEWKNVAQGKVVGCEAHDPILQRYLNVQIRPILVHVNDGPNPSASFAVCSVNDISERKHVEQSLKKSEGQYRSLFQHATIGIFQATPEGKFITANPALARMLGYSSVRKLVKRITHIAEQLLVDPQHWQEIVEIVQSNREAMKVETRCRNKDGREIIVNFILWAVRDDQDNIRYLEGFIEDITESKHTEEALTKSATQIERAKKEWESTADSLLSVICLLDNQGCIIRANRAIEQWNLGKVLNVKGQHFHDLFHPDCSDPKCYLKTLFTQKWEKLAQGETIELETQDMTLQRYLSVQMQPILTQIAGEWGESSSFAVCNVSDITERRHVEELFAKSIRQIERAKKEWESTADTLSSVVCLLDNQGYIVRANRTIEQWYLGHVVEVKGRHLHDLLHPKCSDSTCYLNILLTQEWKKLTQGESIECEAQDPFLQRYLRVQMRPILAQSEEELKEPVSFAVCHIADITEYKQTEVVFTKSFRQIERAKKEWESSADSLPSVMCVLDNQGLILRANRTIEHWNLGQVVNVKGQEIHALFHPNCPDPDCYFKTFLTQEWEHVAQGKSAECEALDSILRRYLNVQIQPITAQTAKNFKDSAGFAVCIVHDITESRQGEKALFNQTVLLRGVTEAMRRLIVGVDLQASMTEALEALGFVMEIDRIHIFETQYHPKTKEPFMNQRFTWTQESSEVQMDIPELQHLPYNPGFARWHELLSTNKTISGLVQDLPYSEQVVLGSQKVISILVVPITIQHHFWGFVRFDDCQRAREWSWEEKSILLTMAGSFGGALTRS